MVTVAFVDSEPLQKYPHISWSFLFEGWIIVVDSYSYCFYFQDLVPLNRRILVKASAKTYSRTGLTLPSIKTRVVSRVVSR